LRLRELKQLFASRYGQTLPDDDPDRDDLFIAAIDGAYPTGDVSKRMVA
jgi:hypothetical protein